MKPKLFFISILLTFSLLLTGCNQSVDDLLGVAQDVFNELFGSGGEVTEQADGEVTDTNVEGQEEVEPEAENDTGASPSLTENVTSFLDQQLSNRDTLGKLPNGFPVDVPYHWVLVDVPNADSNDDHFEGVFCFDLPYEQDDLIDVFPSFNMLDNYEHIGAGDGYFEQTTFTTLGDVGSFPGSVHYFEENDTTCALLIVDFTPPEMPVDEDDENQYGEDPDTMFGEGDPHYESEMALNEDSDTNGTNETTYAVVGDIVIPTYFPFIPPKRIPMRPDQYDELKDQIGTSGLSDGDGTESIREKIRNRITAIHHISHHYPSIFPYEWYPIAMNLETSDFNFDVTFCTDIMTEQSILFHLNMIENYDSDISGFVINGPDNVNNLAHVQFSLNDEFGTGSWHGVSTFYIDHADDNSKHRCVLVTMDFDSEIIN